MEEDAPIVSYEGMNPKKSFEDIILLDGALVYTARGVSMYPLILEKKDVLTITKNENDPKVGDAVLFKRDNGTYVLRRCVAIKKDGFVMCGDNQYHQEKGVLPRQILGVFSSSLGMERPNNNIIHSMSRAGTPTDNPIDESLNGWIKDKLFIDFNLKKCDDVLS